MPDKRVQRVYGFLDAYVHLHCIYVALKLLERCERSSREIRVIFEKSRQSFWIILRFELGAIVRVINRHLFQSRSNQLGISREILDHLETSPKQEDRYRRVLMYGFEHTDHLLVHPH